MDKKELLTEEEVQVIKRALEYYRDYCEEMILTEKRNKTNEPKVK